jgi:penicillin-binding protein 2
MANYVSYFAEGNKNFVPHFLDSVYDQDGNLVYNYEDQVFVSDVFDDYNVSVIRQGMKKAVTSGTCSRLNGLNKNLAAKTGTAQVAGSLNNAWLVGFGPYEDPEFAFVILIEEGGEGSETAMDVAYEIIDYYFNR